MMARPLRFLNLLLALVVVALLVALADSIFNLRLFFEPRAVTVERRSSTGDRQPSAPASEAEASAPQLKVSLPPLNQFETLIAKDPFRNPFGTAAAPESAKPAQLPPLPSLLGTIFVGEERKAILKAGNKSDIYSVGQQVAGGTLVEVREDRVLFRRGEGVAEVIFLAAIEDVTAPRQPGEAQKGRPAARPQTPSPVRPPSPQGPGAASEVQQSQGGAGAGQELRRELDRRRVGRTQRRPEQPPTASPDEPGESPSPGAPALPAEQE